MDLRIKKILGLNLRIQYEIHIGVGVDIRTPFNIWGKFQFYDKIKNLYQLSGLTPNNIVGGDDF